jgi:hypothetical protein
MLDHVLKGSIILAVCITIAGIIGAAIAGSERAFDLSPWFKLGQAAPAPAADTTQFIATTIPTCAAPETSTPIPLATAQTLQQQTSQGVQFADLIDVQAYLGQPACYWVEANIRYYRYHVEGDRSLDAKQQGDAPPVQFRFYGL